MSETRRGRRLATAVGVVAAFVGLYVVQVRNFLLFHGIVETFSVLVAFAVFVITWNSRERLDSSFVVILGTSYLFVGGVDLLHTLAYEGMGVFPAAGTNLPTQLWLFARYLEAFSLVVAGAVGVVNERRPTNFGWNFRAILTLGTSYAVVLALGLAAIFVFDAFPRAHVEGVGLTPFKVLSEYVVVGLFASGLLLLYGQREDFEPRVFHLLAVSILLTMASELAFTFYVDVYGFSNAVGHFFKLGSFYLVYLAVVKTGIREPQKTLYRALSRSEAEARRFKKAAEYSGHAILITDRDGVIQYVNSAWEEMTGYSKAEALGRTPRLVRSGEHDEPFYEELWSTILGGNVWEGQLVNERKNGERFVINQTIAPIFEEGDEIQGFVAIHDEITERREYEERLESDLHRSVKQLKVLARILRHNIRNHMSVILGNAEMLRKGAPDEDAERMAELIVDTGEQLLDQADKQRTIVDLLLNPSTEASLDLRNTVDRVVERLSSTYPEAELTVEVPPDLTVRTLPELSQAVEEVVENAIVHADRDPPRVTVAARAEGQTVEIRIEDNGPGIPAEEREVISGKAEIDALMHSSGMGLWLVDHIVSQAGGTVRFADADPRGSVVTLVVPDAGIDREAVRE